MFWLFIIYNGFYFTQSPSQLKICWTLLMQRKTRVNQMLISNMHIPFTNVFCVTRHVQFFFFKEIISESLKNHNCYKYVRFQIIDKTIRYHYISRPVVVFKCVNIGGETWWSSSVATQLLLYAWTFQGKCNVLKGRFKRNIFFYPLNVPDLLVM